MNFDINELDISDQGIDQISKLLSRVFNNEKKFTFEYINWLYKENPIGEVVGFNAFVGDNLLVAHYALIPIEVILFGKKAKILLSLNTATSQDFQGNGLFTKLAKLSYGKGRDLGFEAVIGIANDDSSHGFTKSLGFNLVCQLDTRLFLGSPTKHSGVQEYDFEYFYNKANIRWRLNNPSGRYETFSSSNQNILYAAGKGIFRPIMSINSEIESFHHIKNIIPRINLWIGLEKEINWSKMLNISIPKYLRPRPLNFIFKDLKQERTLSKNKILFQAINFDAY